MALKREHKMQVMFNMASMTDVIFLLLIFFMVTSTFVFPTALDVTLPKSGVQSAIKPGVKVYIDKTLNISASFAGEEPQPIDAEQLVAFLMITQESNQEQFIALYADQEVPYGKVVEILDISAKNNLKMVLATKPANETYTKNTEPSVIVE